MNYKILYGIIIVMSVLVIMSLRVTTAGGLPEVTVPISVPEDEGRIFVVAPMWSQPSPHKVQFTFADAFSDTPVIRGLYTESSKNAKFLFIIEIALTDEPFYWGTGVDTDQVREHRREYLLEYSEYMKLFGISYIAAYNHSLDESVMQKIASSSVESGNYTFYKVGDGNIVSVLPYTPIEVPKNESWDAAIYYWFVSTNISKVLVRGPAPNVTGSDIQVENITITNDNIAFTVPSDREVPILVRSSYFPTWHAYQEGKEIPIYIASPYMMLVYGNGNIELRQEPHWSQYVGLALTLIGVLIVIGGLYAKRRLR